MTRTTQEIFDHAAEFAKRFESTPTDETELAELGDACEESVATDATDATDASEPSDATEAVDAVEPSEAPDATDADDLEPTPLAILRAAARAHAQAEKDLADSLAAARDAGYSWSAIVAALGTSGESLRQLREAAAN
ncbi:hypothetical protein FK531_20460 [Rhodococcus spelaei]|uniref:Uncharacterized protein n=1 Tax=Rhodococcus spelaei TaxID=2546320 RepID=A0A541B0F4_9NOCA|nr:hypothetical protein [Rhodococcus spelaei]TQF65801.1 hypothetical protein FK531_20460 [Rhodococcus spelaei]